MSMHYHFNSYYFVCVFFSLTCMVLGFKLRINEFMRFDMAQHSVIVSQNIKVNIIVCLCKYGI